jgi:hypothetical protein
LSDRSSDFIYSSPHGSPITKANKAILTASTGLMNAANSEHPEFSGDAGTTRKFPRQ